MNNEEKEVFSEAISIIEKVEVLVCVNCSGNGCINPYQEEEDNTDINSIPCLACNGTGRLIRNTRTSIFPYRGYTRESVIEHKAGR